MLWECFVYFPLSLPRMWKHCMNLQHESLVGFLEVKSTTVWTMVPGVSHSHTWSLQQVVKMTMWSHQVMTPEVSVPGELTESIIHCMRRRCFYRARWHSAHQSPFSDGSNKSNRFSVGSATFLEWWNDTSKYFTCWSQNWKSCNNILMPRNYFKGYKEEQCVKKENLYNKVFLVHGLYSWPFEAYSLNVNP